MCVCILVHGLFGVIFNPYLFFGGFFLGVGFFVVFFCWGCRFFISIVLTQMTLSTLKAWGERCFSEPQKDDQKGNPEKYIKMLVLLLSVQPCKVLEFYCCHWTDLGEMINLWKNHAPLRIGLKSMGSTIGLDTYMQSTFALCFILKVEMWHFKNIMSDK